MNRLLSNILNVLSIGFFFFLLLAPLNQILAVGEGQTCVYSVKPDREIKCDTNLYCDVSDDHSDECESDITCRGTCKVIPTQNIPEGGPCTTTPSNESGGCASGLKCSKYSCTGQPDKQTCNGICRVDVVEIGQGCSVDPDATGTQAEQGNCRTGAFCNTGLDPFCSSTSGMCLGVCFPTGYTCNQELDRRGSGATPYSCPSGYECTEVTGKSPQRVCAAGGGSHGGGQTCSYKCDDCEFACIPAKDVEVRCTCDNRPGANVGSGKNGFSCQNNLKKEHAYCPDAKLGCFDDDPNAVLTAGIFPGQNLYGVRCEVVNNEPPPADPPCVPPYDEKGRCKQVNTSFGNFATDPGAFVMRVFAILLSISGAIALLLIMRAGYRIMTSRGSPEGIKEGREQVVAAIVGLLFLIFSIVFLQVIAGDLLKIPGFGSIGGGGGGLGDTPKLGDACTVDINDCGAGLICVSNGSARSGTCMQVAGQSCDVAGNGQQCPDGQTCMPTGAGRAGLCE